MFDKSIIMQNFIQHTKWMIKFNNFFRDSEHQGPYSPCKPCNHSLYNGIIIFPHIDNTQSGGRNQI